MNIAQSPFRTVSSDAFRYGKGPLSSNSRGVSDFCTTDELAYHSSLEEDDVVELDYTIAKYPDNFGTRQARLLDASTLSNLLQAYTLLFDDPKTADVRFVCPRGPSGKHGYIYAHTTILSHLSEYFKAMFKSGFAEAGAHGLTTLPTFEDMKPDFDDSDSDYEDIDDNEQENLNELNESVLIAVNGEMTAGTSTNDRTDAASQNIGENSQNDRKYMTVKVTKTAYRTYRSLLYYLYTGSMSFAPLTSTYNAERAVTTIGGRVGPFQSRSSYCVKRATVVASGSSNDNTAAWASAKSMYTLCDELNIPEVKKVAFRHIKNSLTPKNIMPEIFSTCSSRYDEIYKAELEYIKKNWAQIQPSSQFKSFVEGLFVSPRPNPLHDSKVLLDIFKVASRRIEYFY